MTRNSHVPEPLRSILNGITDNYRAAHEDLRETMTILKPREKKSMSLTHRYGTDPYYQTTEEELNAQIKELQDTIDRLREEVEMWKDRWECERIDHEATIEHHDKEMRRLEGESWHE
jgi:predicted RNase H-like nuclease (RuvC/YqgF family)